MHAKGVFQKYSAFLIGYCVVTILWGAFVRISGSGNGCGEHWPYCQGTLIPSDPSMKTWIEFFHRIKSGLFGILIGMQTAVAFYLYPAGHSLRKLTTAAIIITFIEALLGALLVIGGYVDADTSISRIAVMTLHLVNTLILLGTLTLIWEASRINDCTLVVPSRRYCIIAVLFLLIAVTGAWAALASTLFPSESLQSGFVSDFSPTSHLLVRLRIFHPLTALAIGFFIIYQTMWSSVEDVGALKRRKAFLHCFVLQLCVGATTLLSLSPTFLKLFHLLVADISWILLILSSDFFKPAKIAEK